MFIGGLVAGIGLESSSFKYGLFHEICTGYELITANGDLITCSKVMLNLPLHLPPRLKATVSKISLSLKYLH